MKNHPYLNLRKRAFTKDVIILGGLEKMAQDDGRLGSRAKDDVLFWAVGPKDPPSGLQHFGWVWRPQTIRDARGGHANFPPKVAQKIKNKHCNLDFLSTIDR